MADQSRFIEELGTPIVWGEAGGSGVTNTISVDALAAGSARMGASADLGSQRADEYLVIVQVESGTAPTAGSGSADLYLPTSPDNTIWPGGVTGSDGAWPADGNEDEWALQLGRPVVQVIPTNDGNVVQTQQGKRWRPNGRYVAPVLDNNWTQAIRDQATASNNLTRVYLYPILRKMIDP